VIHTAEGARTTRELANYFSGPVEASSHAGIDDHAIEQYLPYDRSAWTMLSANPISDQAELCGFAAWTRAQWLDEHRGMVNFAAQWIRDRCLARGIPIRKLSPAQVAAGEAGVCGHWDWTVGMRDGTHTDPGPGFPWDVVIATAGGTGGGSTPSSTEGMLMALSDAEQREILDGIRRLKPGVQLPARSANARFSIDDQYGHTMNGEADAADALAEIRSLRTWLADQVARLAPAGAGSGELTDATLKRIAKAVNDEIARRQAE
jgi:hypothetical protein